MTAEVEYVKVPISLPKDLYDFVEAEKVAQNHENRSRVIADAVRFFKNAMAKSAENARGHRRRSKERLAARRAAR